MTLGVGGRKLVHGLVVSCLAPALVIRTRRSAVTAGRLEGSLRGTGLASGELSGMRLRDVQFGER
jgi:hypothetical protein